MRTYANKHSNAAVDNGYYVCSLNGRAQMDYISEEMCSILGYTSDEIRNKYDSDCTFAVYKDDIAAYKKHISDRTSTPGTSSLKYRLVSKDGSVKLMSEKMTSSMSDGVMRSYATVKDISDTLKRPGEATGKKKSSLRIKGAATFEFDFKTLQLSSSPELDKLVGYEMQSDWFMMIHERAAANPEFDYQELLHAYGNLIVTGEYQELVLKTKNENGLMWIKIEMTPISEDGKMVTGIFGVVRNVTSTYVKKQMEAKQDELIMEKVHNKYPMALSLNLTSRRFKVIFGGSFLGFKDESEGNNDDLINAAMRKIPQEYHKGFKDTCSRDVLLEAYAKGEKSISFDYNEIHDIESIEKTVCYRFYITFMKSITGNDVMATVVLEDVTDLKEKNFLLKRDYDMTIENMPGYACKWMFEENDIILMEANAAFFDFIKASPEEVIGKSIIYTAGGEERREIIKNISKANETHSDTHYTGIMYNYLGEKVWVTIHGSYYNKDHGKSIYCCVITDVTSIVNMHTDLDKRSEELRLAADMVENTILEYHVNERKIHVLSEGDRKAGFNRLDGHAPEYALERKLVSFIRESSFHDAFIAIEHGRKEGKLQFAVEHEDGARWYSGKYRTMFDDNGKPERALIAINDVTDMIASDALKMVEDVAFESLSKVQLLAIANLSTGFIEHESGNPLAVSFDEIISYEEYKEHLTGQCCRIDEDCHNKWLEFMDSERLIESYRSGNTYETFEFDSFEGCHGKPCRMRLHVKLQDSEYDEGIHAYMLFEELNAMTPDSEEYKEVSIDSDAEKKKIQIRTFGHFEVFVDGKPMLFPSEKAKEMLAVLVDRRGGFVSNYEMAGYLWENEGTSKSVQARCRKTASRMNKILEENGIAGIVENTNGKRRIIPENIECDYFTYMSDRVKNNHLFTGAYMLDYNWGEYTLSILDNKKDLY